MRGALIRAIIQALLFELSIVTVAAYSEAQVKLRRWTPDESTGLLTPVPRPLHRWRA